MGYSFKNSVLTEYIATFFLALIVKLIAFFSYFSEDSKEKKETVNNERTIGTATTNRCIDCSRESWKTKKFTHVGMNTEISLNPATDVDLSKTAFNGQQQASPQINQTNNNDHNDQKPNFKHNAPNNQTSPVPLTQTRASDISSFPSQKDYMNPHAKQSSLYNGEVAHRDNGERHAHRERPATSPTYGLEFYGNHHGSQLRYPSLEAPVPHYERFVQSHGWMVERPPRYEQSRSPRRDNLSPGTRRSPARRSRSPISPRSDMRGEYMHSHYHAFHDKYRPVLLPTNFMHGSRRRGENRVPLQFDGNNEVKNEAGFLRKETSFKEKELPQPTNRPAGPAGEFRDNRAPVPQPGDEPPVFVLPNDYDIVSGIDPRIASIQDNNNKQQSGKFSPGVGNDKDGDKPTSKGNSENAEKDIKDEYTNSPNGSTTECYSPKTTNTSTGGDSPDSSTNNSLQQKLYCKICNGVFPTKSLLYKHLRGHTSDEKPFKCNECGQGFTLSSNLRQHRIIHRGYKPFQCEFCGKKFMRSNVYKQHRRIHTGEEMHKCGLCPSEFLQKYALLKHMKKNHDIDAVDN